ncbi:hypothetical protein DNTS_011642, partial [Danionella cerebrum]
YKGKANLHVFEDWCGSSISQLRKNLHFPLYPHFAIASDDNSELWLSSDESPFNTRLLVYVGQHGLEWTAPGEFTKFRSQSSKAVRLLSSRRYFFEVLHKQDDIGSDHVEVAWKPFLPGLKFEVIDSAYISLYTDESGLKMNSVHHIPQTLASHSLSQQVNYKTGAYPADMLKVDPRDTFYKSEDAQNPLCLHGFPMIDQRRLEGVLPSCVYSPTYVVKDFPMARYQGLQFVYLSYMYPNDFTRLTHMEKKNKCFYRESPVYLEKFGFYKYMKMDGEEEEDGNQPVFIHKPEDFLEEEEGVDPEETINFSNQAVKRSSPSSETSRSFAYTASSKPRRLNKASKIPIFQQTSQDVLLKQEGDSERMKSGLLSPHSPWGEETIETGLKEKGSTSVLESRTGSPIKSFVQRGRSLTWLPYPLSTKTSKVKGRTAFKHPQNSPLIVLANTILGKPLIRTSVEKESNNIYITRSRLPRDRPKTPVEVFPGVFLYKSRKSKRLVALSSKWRSLKTKAAPSIPWENSPLMDHKTSDQFAPLKLSHLSSPTEPGPHKESHPTASISDPDSPPLSSSEIRDHPGLNFSECTRTTKVKPTKLAEGFTLGSQSKDLEEGNFSEYSDEDTEARPDLTEKVINWQRTFSVNPLDFELLRSDWNDLRCNISGNLQLAESEVIELISQYMERLNQKNGGIYTLARIVNVEKRRDSARGNRYLVELLLTEEGKRVVRLSEYVYLLLHRSRHEEELESREGTVTASQHMPYTIPAPSVSMAQTHRNTPWSTSRNQARWVQQFISDMEHLHRETRDENFSVIIVDFQSDDMDVEQSLKDSTVPRFEYLRREGNFERASGLQMGVDAIEDVHSIVFLCDLHIHFPLSILESVRKHCVEGRLAFAPIVMRLDCGSSPLEPEGTSLP